MKHVENVALGVAFGLWLVWGAQLFAQSPWQERLEWQPEGRWTWRPLPGGNTLKIEERLLKGYGTRDLTYAQLSLIEQNKTGAIVKQEHTIFLILDPCSCAVKTGTEAWNILRCE